MGFDDPVGFNNEIKGISKIPFGFRQGFSLGIDTRNLLNPAGIAARYLRIDCREWLYFCHNKSIVAYFLTFAERESNICTI